MQAGKRGLDEAFVERQRQQLLRLRQTLLAASGTVESDEADVRGTSAREALEFEDDAQRLDALERDGLLVARDAERLEHVTRALKKIEEGTYGLSDMSGQPIPRERLEAAPEALYTLAEEERREQARVG
jgi:DnaK suppressor protein